MNFNKKVLVGAAVAVALSGWVIALSQSSQAEQVVTPVVNSGSDDSLKCDSNTGVCEPSQPKEQPTPVVDEQPTATAQPTQSSTNNCNP